MVTWYLEVCRLPLTMKNLMLKMINRQTWKKHSHPSFIIITMICCVWLVVSSRALSSEIGLHSKKKLLCFFQMFAIHSSSSGSYNYSFSVLALIYWVQNWLRNMVAHLFQYSLNLIGWESFCRGSRVIFITKRRFLFWRYFFSLPVSPVWSTCSSPIWFNVR